MERRQPSLAPVNLALVTETFPPEVNGVAMTFGVIARELGRRGHTVTVYRPRRDDLPAGEIRPEYAEVPLPSLPVPGYPQLRLGWPAGRTLGARWRAERPDLVHVVTEGPLGASAIAAARALGIPVTSSFHTNFHTYTRDYGFAPLGRLVLAWLRRVHNRTACTFAPTPELADELRSAGFRAVSQLSRGVDTWQFHPARRQPELRRRWGADPDTPVVLHVGRMAAEKNYGLLFRAYDAMRAANPRLKFVLAGEGPLRARLQREHPECIFAGFFSREEIGRYYASADIYLHASVTETFGNVLTEAMASGLAVAGFDYAAARRFVRHGVNGLAVPLGDAAALIDAAVLLATDDLLRAQLRAAARGAVEAQSWSAVIARFESDLGQFARGQRPDTAGEPATAPLSLTS
jgi:glycosyltransferase involved in cell wall biosynthesis